VPSARNGERGDQYVEIQVVVPPPTDERVRNLMKELESVAPEDPRKDCLQGGSLRRKSSVVSQQSSVATDMARWDIFTENRQLITENFLYVPTQKNSSEGRLHDQRSRRTV